MNEKQKILNKEAIMEKKKWTQAVVSVVRLEEDVVTLSKEREAQYEQSDFFSNELNF